VRTSTNFKGPEVNDHVSFNDPEICETQTDNS
jgi:hypothetical protein